MMWSSRGCSAVGFRGVGWPLEGFVRLSLFAILSEFILLLVGQG